MTIRSLFLTIAAALVVAGIGALDARAGSVALPQPYSTLLIPGTYTTVVGAETAHVLQLHLRFVDWNPPVDRHHSSLHRRPRNRLTV